MPDLLLELFSEEIPARMQARAAEDLRKLVTDRLVEAGLVYEGAKRFVTPRRLALACRACRRASPMCGGEEGPARRRAGGRHRGLSARPPGLTRSPTPKVQPDKKGDFYVAVIEKPGRAAIDVIAEILPEVIKSFPWPKSMRWGAQSQEPGALELGAAAAFDRRDVRAGDRGARYRAVRVDGIAAGNETRGHRFLAPAPFTVRRLDDYVAKLDKAKVVLDAERRKRDHPHEAKNLAFAQGSNWSKTTGCSMRSPAWSNGRWC